jgi:hypothetical protein
MMPEQVWYLTKLTQSGTKIRDAGMPMPELISSMPMPSFAPFFINGAILFQMSLKVIQYPPKAVLEVIQYPLAKD